jgi:hypothetical protein
MTTLKVEIDNDRDLTELYAELTRMGLKYKIEDDTNDGRNNLPEARVKDIDAGLTDGEPKKRRTIIDIVGELGSHNIDPKADLMELYYQDPKHGG